MNKTFKSYIAVWAICFILFNAIAFIIPNELKSNFWNGYIFITLTFFGQLFCANIAFKSENAQKFFYNFPLISISFIGVVAMLVIGGLTMAITAIPVWVGIVLCLIVLAFTAIAVINVSIVSETVSTVDNKTKANTFFVKALIADAQILMLNAETAQTKDITKKVYEAIRYSDPISSNELSDIEAQITADFRKFECAVQTNAENATSIGEKLVILIENRNTKCKFFK